MCRHDLHAVAAAHGTVLCGRQRARDWSSFHTNTSGRSVVDLCPTCSHVACLCGPKPLIDDQLYYQCVPLIQTTGWRMH